MLHILLLIIKILLITVSAILAFLLLTILTVLFVPVRYRISGEYDNSSQYVAGKVSWLLHIVSFTGGYSKENKAFYALRIFGIRINLSKKAKPDKSDKKQEKNVFDSETSVQEKEAEEYNGKSDVADSENQDLADEEKSGYVKSDEAKEESDNKETFKEKVSFSQKLKKVKESLTELINNTKETKEKISKKLNNPDYKELAGFLWNQFKKLMGIIKPKKGSLYVHFGFDDVETTGKAAMYLAVLYGLLGLDIQIYPDFDNKVLEGKVKLIGSIRLWGIVVIAIRCFLNKNFRKYILKK